MRVMLIAPGRTEGHLAGFALRWKALSDALESPDFSYVALDDSGSNIPLSLSESDVEHADDDAGMLIVRSMERFRPDVVVLTELRTVPYLPLVRSVAECVVVVDMHNVESHLKRQLAAADARAGHTTRYTADVLNLVRRLELLAIDLADQIWLCSKEDCQILRSAYPDRLVPLHVVPNAVSVPGSSGPAIPGTTRKVVFVGTLGYPPNERAIRFIAHELLPLLKLPDHFIVEIAGSQAPDSVRELADLVGLKLNENFESFEEVTRGAILIAPLWEGSGTRFKLLEAMAHRVPIVATRLAAEGLDVVDRKEIMFAENAEEFNVAIRAVADDLTISHRLCDRSLDLVRRQYSIPAMREKIATALRSV